MKRIISKNTIKVGNKYYTEEKYWARFPSDRIITTRTRQILPRWVYRLIKRFKHWIKFKRTKYEDPFLYK